jgi:hypothetical protein
VAGSDTVITWEGVGPDEPVKLEYSTNNGTNWVTLSERAIGLSYTWRVPRIASSQCLARVTADGKKAGDIEMVPIPAGTFQMGNTGAYGGFLHEKPVRSVTISRDFLMSMHMKSPRNNMRKSWEQIRVILRVRTYRLRHVSLV